MAKKGQKFMEYDNDFREKVVLDYLNSNLGYKKIAEKYFIESWKTVETWVHMDIEELRKAYSKNGG